MIVFYHPDIITKMFGVFLTHSSDPNNAYKIIEDLGSVELKRLLDDPNVINRQFGTYVTKALLDVVQKHPNFGSSVGIVYKQYYPETMDDKDASKTIMGMCAQGKFIPFIITLNKIDLHPISDNDILIIVAGIGDNPCQNFMVISINIMGMLNALHITLNTSDDDSTVHMVYPIMFNAIDNTVISILPKNCTSVKVYLLAPQLNEDE